MEADEKEIIFSCSYGKEKLKKMQEILWDVYCKVSDIFDKNGIRYFLICGSLLGVMRHGGFIPWDDDLDIAVLNDDYDSAMQILEKNLPSGFFMQNKESDPCYLCDWTKLQYTNSTVFNALYQLANTFKYKGIAMDIFRCWPDNISRYTKKWRIHRSAFNYHVSNISNKKSKKVLRSIVALCYHLVIGSFYYFIDVFFQKKDVYDMDPQLYPPIDRGWLFPLDFAYFNGRKCPVPANSDNVLTLYYGNWHELPREEERRSHYGEVDIWE
jgi:lipopolysaccharide cholinephosphotransferase